MNTNTCISSPKECGHDLAELDHTPARVASGAQTKTPPDFSDGVLSLPVSRHNRQPRPCSPGYRFIVHREKPRLRRPGAPRHEPCGHRLGQSAIFFDLPADQLLRLDTQTIAPAAVDHFLRSCADVNMGGPALHSNSPEFRRSSLLWQGSRVHSHDGKLRGSLPRFMSLHRDLIPGSGSVTLNVTPIGLVDVT
jgi:hypothetical protein